MAAHLDAIGNVCGRYEGERPGLPCLMLGSHYDTVRDAGKWDGPLGLDHGDCLRRGSAPARRAAAVCDRSDRFCRRGRRAVCLHPARQPGRGRHVRRKRAQLAGGDGLTMREAMTQFGLDPDHIGAAARVAPRTAWPMSNCISSRGRCWSSKTCRSAWSRRSPARRGWRRASPAWPATPARCRWRCGATRWRAPPNASSRSRQFCRTDEAGLVGTVGVHHCAAGRHQCHSGAGVVHPRHSRADGCASQARGGRYRAADRSDRQAARAGAADRRHPREPHRALRAMAESAGGGSRRRAKVIASSNCRAGPGMTAWR